MATLKRPVTPEEAAQYGYKDVTNTSPNNTPVTANQSTGYTYKPVQIYQPGMTLDSFNQQAQNQYMPAYNEKVNALKNALAQNLLALEGQKTGINRNYDMQSRNQNINTTKSKNNFSNTMLGRGLGRSTIAGTGLGEMDVINNRVQNDIEGFRTGDLGNIDAQMAQMQVGTNNQLTTMAGDLQTQIMALAQNLYDNYQNNMFKQESFNTGNQFDVEKYNNSNSQWQQSFDYGKSQDTQKQENWNKEYDLDKWYKEQVLAKDSGGNGNYKSPNGFGNDAQAKEYDQVLTTAKYIIGSNRPMANKTGTYSGAGHRLDLLP